LRFFVIEEAMLSNLTNFGLRYIFGASGHSASTIDGFHPTPLGHTGCGF
jgi:hypothetical protein